MSVRPHKNTCVLADSANSLLESMTRTKSLLRMPEMRSSNHTELYVCLRYAQLKSIFFTATPLYVYWRGVVGFVDARMS